MRKFFLALVLIMASSSTRATELSLTQNCAAVARAALEAANPRDAYRYFAEVLPDRVKSISTDDRDNLLRLSQAMQNPQLNPLQESHEDLVKKFNATVVKINSVLDIKKCQLRFDDLSCSEDLQYCGVRVSNPANSFNDTVIEGQTGYEDFIILGEKQHDLAAMSVPVTPIQGQSNPGYVSIHSVKRHFFILNQLLKSMRKPGEEERLLRCMENPVGSGSRSADPACAGIAYAPKISHSQFLVAAGALVEMANSRIKAQYGLTLELKMIGRHFYLELKPNR